MRLLTYKQVNDFQVAVYYITLGDHFLITVTDILQKCHNLWPIQKKLLQRVLSYFTRVACTKIVSPTENTFFWKLILEYFFKKNKTKQNYIDKLAEPLVLPVN